jgi:hypothetical protein
MLSWQMGAVKITCVVEMLIPFPYDPEHGFLWDATPEALKASSRFYPHFAEEEGTLIASEANPSRIVVTVGGRLSPTPAMR